MKAQEAIQSFPTGGWLASDIGMGKTAIVLALVASDAEQQQDGTITTVVLTSVSLMGQWEDEAKKHAPGLSIRCFHPPSRSRVALDLRIIRDVDIIISTATFEWPRHVTDHVEFHRVVMDEAHLLSNTSTANLSWAMKLRAKRRWCVTATPCTSSILDLKLQMKFLEIKNNTPLSDAFQKLVDSGSNDTAQSNNDAAFDTFVQLFSNFVTRHEKSQLVGGTEALALPSKVCKVVTLKMSCQEKTQFQENLRKVNKRLIQNYRRFGGMSFVLEETLIRPLSSDNLFTSWNQSTKIIALLQEMKSLQQRDSNLRAVVFTHYSKTQTDVVQALKSFFGIPVVYEIRLSTPAKDRDFALRVFQGPRTFPACIVVMLRSFVTLPFVGMALTQASHLYLMEPSLDPAAEIAMGRIHRLGQEREIEMKKFVLAETVEANMVALHKEIENGRIQMPNRNVSADAVKVLTRGFSI
jgi:SNF2 family DNA or RNA helicase